MSDNKNNRDPWWIWLFAPIIIPLWLGHGLVIFIRELFDKEKDHE